MIVKQLLFGNLDQKALSQTIVNVDGSTIQGGFKNQKIKGLFILMSESDDHELAAIAAA